MCLQIDPTMRPSFAKIQQELEKFVSDMIPTSHTVDTKEVNDVYVKIQDL